MTNSIGRNENARRYFTVAVAYNIYCDKFPGPYQALP